MSNREVAQAFANGRLASGSNFYTEHVVTVTSPQDDRRYVVLFSYSTPVAFAAPDGMFYFDARKYSVTTSKHVSYAKGACPANNVCELSHDEFRRQCRELGVYLGGAR